MKKSIIAIVIILPITLLYAKATLYNYSGVDKKIKLRHDIYYYANERRDPEAQYNLAMRYKKGLDGPVNLKKAFYYFHKSAIKNYAPAQYQLGIAFRRGLGVKENQQMARYWIKRSARNRYESAINLFRKHYMHKPLIKRFKESNN